MQDIDFYQAHLDRVSRSFAFCIRKLDAPMRRWVALAYLLCRSLDTVEDSAWADPRARDLQYGRFEGFVKARPSETEVREWASLFPRSIPDGERRLLDDALFLFEDLHALPERLRSDIRLTVLRMSGGMRHYSSLEGSSGVLKLVDLTDVNRYCYFVAGVVGELLTRLLTAHRPDFRPGPDFLKNAFHFGLFLQKVNLLKDQRGDEAQGRFLVPDRERLMASLRENARGSLRYLTALPSDEKGYRTFCAWSLFLGLASLPWIHRSFSEGSDTKIPREATQELLAQIEAIAQDDRALWERGEECLAFFPEASDGEATGRSPRDDAWFHRISGDVLAPADLSELGISQSLCG